VTEVQRRRRLPYLLVPIACFIAASNVGNALFPTLSTDRPLLLLALNARNSSLLAVANQLDPVSYYVVGTLRLVAADPLFYLLGLWYGEVALTWLDERAGSNGRLLRTLQRFFAKASYPLVFFVPNQWFCLFAGAARMPWPAFLVLNVSGTVARLVVFRLIGDVFDEPITAALDFLGDYRWPLTALTIAIVFGQMALDRRKGTDDMTALAKLEEAVDDDAGPPSPGGDPGREPPSAAPVDDRS
jgi:membrane protein DedA with SNARE-associated domain